MHAYGDFKFGPGKDDLVLRSAPGPPGLLPRKWWWRRQIRSESGAHVSPVGRRPAARDLLDGRFQISTADRALDFL